MSGKEKDLTKEDFNTIYGLISEEVVEKVVSSFKEGFYSDFQQSPDTSRDILFYEDKEKGECVDRFLNFMCDDLRPHLIKAINEVKEYAEKNLK